ncbi:hypothetical protein FC84_GL001585 [Lapidilactobacillus dextrinicus DSM 20335]|uniref:Uncharacterized protein n=1 Tax=Lapidilactobacillus dextrinicus DSM 20335 TaxID=1423738 RepID=A0A0R2BJA6_9LACO|nr:hypothetical protein [Lapidilactobacillus dextrinicus]KRM79409.1 hypothetical protein FC84_GL001585 [Lapidilactobacillus dextrinicus DSM 20335]QFG46758.1 hypothetical protein LH506_04540 [Lapidilactobacillus dextrinicus]
MSLIKLKLAADNTVMASGWANPNQREVGDVIDGFTVYDVSDDEIKKLIVNHTKLINNHLVIDTDYVPPVEIPTDPQPSEEQQAITDLAISSAEHSQHIQSIEEAITAFAQSKIGGTN